MKCFHCNEEIVWNKKEPTKEARYKMVGLDRPYLNLFFHIDCFAEIKENLIEYLAENVNYVIQLLENKEIRRGIRKNV